MNQQPLRTATPTIDIYIRLAQYPILADRVRDRMRQELYRRGIVNPDVFEHEVRELAIASQRREGLGDPYFEEDPHSWDVRLERVRDLHTDALFADHLGIAQLDVLLEDVLNSRSAASDDVPISFNPEIAPWEMLFQQGEIYERMAPEELERHQHHLEEIKVVLVRRLLSDHLPFIGVAKRVLTISDLRRIYHSRIGTGKIGGKAAGMYLAWRILEPLDATLNARELRDAINIPDSYFIGTDVIYEFFLMNKLEHYMNQKYLPVHEIRAEYPRIVAAFLAADLPESLVMQVRDVVQSLGNSPLIVRSSSLLEDNFGFTFAGKYNSYFCPNQGTPEENVAAVLDAIRLVYASSLNPDALLYRKKNDLIDYDERMAILLQRVNGRWHGRYFFPDLAGVGFSQNPFCWSPEIRQGEGFLRLVTGLGTRAVERVSQDYPRLIPLSHPQLRPERTIEDMRRYSQRFLDVVDRESNAIVTIPVREALANSVPLLSVVASLDTGDRLQPILPSSGLETDDHIVLTFDTLTRDQTFIDMLRTVLQKLEEVYEGPVDVEFAVDIEPVNDAPEEGMAEFRRLYRLYILECRPLNERRAMETEEMGERPSVEGRRIFSVPTLLPTRAVEQIEFLVFVDPERYYDLKEEIRRQVAATVTTLNDRLPAGRFALIGPGRWGSQNSRLSVPITYSDICNSRLLVEISPPYTPAPEWAYGTDFYEDVVEADIVVLGIQPTPGGGAMDWEFLRGSPNQLLAFVPDATEVADSVRVIDVRAAGGSPLRVVIDEETSEAVACFDAPG